MRGALRWLALAGVVLALTGAVEARGAKNPTYHNFVGGRVILVGNSHTWLSRPDQAYARYDVDARPGRARMLKRRIRRA